MLKQKWNVQHRLAAAAAIALALVIVTLLSGGARSIFAAITGSGYIPESMNYQGVLSTGSGPWTGTAQMSFALYEQETGGSSVWSEMHSSVPVNNGHFAVVLGSQGSPLGASYFAGAERWLQVSADMGGGPVTMPRQRLHAVPYALQAYRADHATTADTALSPPNGSAYANVVIVAKSGGDYTSVAAALASITTATAESPWLVWVAPGTYEEETLVEVPSYVHLQGAGLATTKIRSTRYTATPHYDGATAYMRNYSRMSDLTIANDATTGNAYGVYVDYNASQNTVMDNVRINVTANGGVGHTGIYVLDGEPAIRRSIINASGATVGNTALAVFRSDSTGTLPAPQVVDTRLRGEGTGGYGMQIFNASAVIRESEIYGSARGIYVNTNGATSVYNSIIEIPVVPPPPNPAYLFETQGGAMLDIYGSLVIYSRADPTTRHTGNNLLRCMNNYLRLPFFPYVADYLQDGFSSATACALVP